MTQLIFNEIQYTLIDFIAQARRIATKLGNKPSNSNHATTLTMNKRKLRLIKRRMTIN